MKWILFTLLLYCAAAAEEGDQIDVILHRKALLRTLTKNDLDSARTLLQYRLNEPVKYGYLWEEEYILASILVQNFDILDTFIGIFSYEPPYEYEPPNDELFSVLVKKLELERETVTAAFRSHLKSEEDFRFFDIITAWYVFSAFEYPQLGEDLDLKCEAFKAAFPDSRFLPYITENISDPKKTGENSSLLQLGAAYDLYPGPPENLSSFLGIRIGSGFIKKNILLQYHVDIGGVFTDRGFEGKGRIFKKDDAYFSSRIGIQTGFYRTWKGRVLMPVLGADLQGFLHDADPLLLRATLGLVYAREQEPAENTLVLPSLLLGINYQYADIFLRGGFQDVSVSAVLMLMILGNR